MIFVDMDANVASWVHLEPQGDSMSSIFPPWPCLIILQQLLLLLSQLPYLSFLQLMCIPLIFEPHNAQLSMWNIYTK
jgi:hypothetical protein